MRALLCLVPWSVVLAACSDAEPIGIHLRLAADGTGVVTCRSLQVVDSVGPLESGSAGVQWQERARLFASRGQVADLVALRLADIEVKRTGANSLRIVFPRGPEAAWHALLAPAAEGRGTAAAVLDPARPAVSIGGTIRIEIEAPELVTAVGHAPAARMVKSDKDGKSGLIWLPVETVRGAGEAIVFDLTWR
jgi:hypothetical protein